MTTSPDDRMLIVRVYPPEHRVVRVIHALALRPREDVHGEEVSLRWIPFQASHMPRGIQRGWVKFMVLRRFSPRGQRTPLDS